MKLIVAAAAVKELAGLPRHDREALIAKAEALADDPFGAHGWAAPLKGGPDRVRIRQGNWRALLRIDRREQVVTLERVASRGEIYR